MWGDHSFLGIIFGSGKQKLSTAELDGYINAVFIALWSRQAVMSFVAQPQTQGYHKCYHHLLFSGLAEQKRRPEWWWWSTVSAVRLKQKSCGAPAGLSCIGRAVWKPRTAVAVAGLKKLQIPSPLPRKGSVWMNRSFWGTLEVCCLALSYATGNKIPVSAHVVNSGKISISSSLL